VEEKYALYYSPGACSLAPHIALEEVGRPYELRRVDLAGGEQRRPEYLAINPRGRVPALVSPGGEILTEAPAILLYLARRHPEAALLPKDPEGEARVFEWMSWLASAVHAGTVALIWRPERFSDDEALHPALKEKGRRALRERYADIDERLRGRRFAVGDSYSAADAYLVVFYRWGYRVGFDMRADYPAWAGAAELSAGRPAVKAALAQEGIILTG
jgi:glutathione S-transferase